MANRVVILILLGVLFSTPSAFKLRPTLDYRDSRAIEKNSIDITRRVTCALSMTPRELRLKSREGSPMMMKQARSKKSYNVPGYVKGKLDLIRAVFRAHSADGQMSYNAFLDSRYLRFWPGTSIREAFMYCF